MIVLVGGGSGIGAALAGQLVARGEQVLVASRQSFATTAAELGCEGAAVDARNFDEVERLLAQHAPVTGLACSVGSLLIRPAHLTTEADFVATVETNLKTAFACVRAAARHMANGGSVVLFSTVACQVGLPHHELIAAAKGGIEALVRSAAASQAGRGVRYNAIAPALTMTPMTERLTARAAVRAASEAMIPLGRLGQAAEVAHVAAWLLSSEASWVTGQVLTLDGGLSTLRPAPRQA